MTEIYLHFLFAHYGLYGNAPVDGVLIYCPGTARRHLRRSPRAAARILLLVRLATRGTTAERAVALEQVLLAQQLPPPSRRRRHRCAIRTGILNHARLIFAYISDARTLRSARGATRFADARGRRRQFSAHCHHRLLHLLPAY